MRSEAEWAAEAKRILRAEMVRRGVTYDELAKKLAKIGVEQSPLKPQNDDKPRPLSRHVASSVLNRNEMPVASHYRPGREWITVLFSRPRARHSLEIGRGWAHRARPCTFCGSVRGTSRKADASFTASSGKSAPKLNRSLLNNSLSF
jgi:uncharacterized protein DUF6471